MDKTIADHHSYLILIRAFQMLKITTSQHRLSALISFDELKEKPNKEKQLLIISKNAGFILLIHFTNNAIPYSFQADVNPVALLQKIENLFFLSVSGNP